MALPTYVLGVNWNGDGSTYVNEAARLLQGNITRGRNSELAVAESGRCTLRMGNEDGRYTPEYTGPLYGNLQSGRRIYLEVSLGAVTETIFKGFITNLRPDFPARQCVFECEDMFWYLREFHLNLEMSLDTLASQRVTDILDVVGVDVVDRDISISQTVFPYSHWRNTDALAALLEVAENEVGGLFFIARDGKCTFQDRHYRPKVLAGGTLTPSVFKGITYNRRDSEVYTQAILEAGGISEGPPGSQIWSLSPLPTRIGVAELLDLDINYQVSARDVIPPVVTDDYAATEDEAGTGADRTADLTIVKFKDYSGGAEWQIRNDGVTPLWLQRCRIRGTPLQPTSHLRTVTRTAATTTAPFPRKYTHRYSLISDVNLLADYADYIVRRYNEPNPTIAFSLPIGKSGTEDYLGIDVSDRYPVEDIGTPWQSNVDTDYFVERVAHDFACERDRPKFHTISLQLSIAETDDFWVLGTSHLDTETILGY